MPRRRISTTPCNSNPRNDSVFDSDFKSSLLLLFLRSSFRQGFTPSLQSRLQRFKELRSNLVLLLVPGFQLFFDVCAHSWFYRPALHRVPQRQIVMLTN